MNLFCDTMIYHTSCPKTYSIYNMNLYSFYSILFTCYYCFSIKKNTQDKTYQILHCTDSAKVRWHWQQTYFVCSYFVSSQAKIPTLFTVSMQVHRQNTSTSLQKQPDLEASTSPLDSLRKSAHTCVWWWQHMDVLWKGLEAQDSLRLQVQALQQCRYAALRHQRQDAALPSANWLWPDIENRERRGSSRCWQSPASWGPFSGTQKLPV